MYKKKHACIVLMGVGILVKILHSTRKEKLLHLSISNMEFATYMVKIFEFKAELRISTE